MLESLVPGLDHVPKTGSFSPDELKECIQRNFRLQLKESEASTRVNQARFVTFKLSLRCPLDSSTWLCDGI